MTFHILGISGSLRKSSYNTAALRAVGDLLPPDTTFEIAKIDDLPFYNEDLRVNGSFPPEVQRLRSQIAKADALVFAVPEYNYSLSAVLKNAIDWASRAPNQPFDWKPFGIVGAATGVLGTVRAQMALRHMMIGLNAYPVNVPQVMISGAAQKFDADGHLVDPAARDLISQHLQALVKLAHKLKA